MKLRKHKIFIGWSIVVLSAFVVLPCSAKIIDRVVALVNDDAITLSELTRETMARMGGAQTAPSPEVYQQVLYGLIEQKLILREAIKLETSISDREVDQAIERIRRQSNVSVEEIKAALGTQGIEWEEYRQQVREDIMRNQAVAIKVRSQAGVTDKDLNNYYENHIEEFLETAKVRIEQLFFPIPAGATVEQRNAVVREAEEVLARVNDGHDLSVVAVEAGVIEEGESLDLGYFNKGDLLEPLDEAAFSIPVGSVSDVIETPRGYTIIRVVDRQEETLRTLEEVAEDITDEIYQEKVKKRFQEWIDELYQEAYIEIKL
jgi:peptidyl-prolyl cis-trans isomerase SurA